MITHSEDRKELFKALLNVQAAIVPITQDANNPFFKSRYSTLENVWETIKSPLHKNGLVITQPMREIDGHTYLETLLFHTESGQWQSSLMRLRATKEGPQEYGSALTYARRYSLMSLLCLTSGDDDGEAAQGRSIPPISLSEFYVLAAERFKISVETVQDIMRSSGMKEYNPATINAYLKYIQSKL